jgi:hypothetical protein
VTIACVLRSGGVYDRRWVDALRCQVEKYAPGVEFRCLTNVAGVDGALPLAHNLPGWWSKMELFRPGLFSGRVLYLDLDTLVVGSLSPLLEHTDGFAMLADFYREERPMGRPRFGESGVMAWVPSRATNELWQRFSSGPAMHMQVEHRDGAFVRHNIVHSYLQDLYPGLIVSFKIHAHHEIPDGASLVCGHGEPKFDTPAAGWAHKMWTAYAGEGA